MRSIPIYGLILWAALLHAQNTGNTQPTIIVRNDPEYSAEAARARVQSTVLLSIVVGVDGKAHDVRVAKGAGFGLDQKAIEAIDTWLFKPGTKDGKPAPMPANVEMNFHLQVRNDTEDHSGQFARLNFSLPPGATRPELIMGKLPGNPATAGDQALRFSLQVGIDGTPKNITSLGATDQAWEQKALRAIRAWRFRPASLDGAAIPADGVFELAHSAPPEPEPVIIEQSDTEEVARPVPAPIPIAGLIARGNHTATLLANGTILLAGGAAPGAGSHELASAQIFDGTTRTIANTGNMLTARQHHTATLLKDGTVLIAGGQANGHPLAGAEIFDPSTGKFSPAGSMREARSSHSAALLPDGRVLICGGAENPAGTEIYDPRTKSFMPGAPMAVAMASPRSVILKDGRVLLIGGSGAAAEVFNPESGTFTVTGDMTTPHIDASATRLENGQVLIAGGSGADKTSTLAGAEIFNPLTNAFSATGAMAMRRAGHAAVLLNTGKVLIAGGSADGVNGALAATEIYDPASGTFSLGPLLKGMHAGHTATVLEDGSVLVAGSSVPGSGGSAELLLIH